MFLLIFVQLDLTKKTNLSFYRPVRYKTKARSDFCLVYYPALGTDVFLRLQESITFPRLESVVFPRLKFSQSFSMNSDWIIMPLERLMAVLLLSFLLSSLFIGLHFKQFVIILVNLIVGCG